MTVSVITIDFETRSRVDLKKSGAYRYAEDFSTEIICLYYTLDDGDPQAWTPAMGQACPDDLSWAIRGGAIVDAHGVHFEHSHWQLIMVPLYGWPEIYEEQWDCTQAACLYKGLPPKLEKVADVLEMTNRKTGLTDAQLTKATKPDKKGNFKEDAATLQGVYTRCEGDVLAERELRSIVGRLTPEERQVWLLDQKANRRGVQIDLPAVHSALKVCAQVEERLTKELQQTTKGTIETHNQVAKIVEFCNANGVPMEDLTGARVEHALKLGKNMPDNVRRVLEIRSILGRASVKKLHMMLSSVCEDGRCRYLLQYHGAGPGRWAGRLVQPQNFPRPSEALEHTDIEDIIGIIKQEDAELADMVFGDAMDAVATGLRGMFIAGRDKELAVGDFKAIEAIVLSCLAGADHRIEAFRKGVDIYCMAAELIFGHPVNKKEHPAKRTIGKICELAFGYQGGEGAWLGFEPFGDRKPGEIDGYKDAWRKKNPEIPKFWRGIEEAGVMAVATGEPHEFNGIEYRVEGEWLSCRLLSGRKLWYYKPGVIEVPVPWSDEETRLQLTYWAWKEGRWRHVHAYGGLQTQNICEGVARDLLVNGMLKAEKNGYPCILTVHDENVTEPNAGRGGAKELAQIMADVPAWAKTWPVSCDTWVGGRYRK